MWYLKKNKKNKNKVLAVVMKYKYLQDKKKYKGMEFSIYIYMFNYNSILFNYSTVWIVLDHIICSMDWLESISFPIRWNYIIFIFIMLNLMITIVQEKWMEHNINNIIKNKM